MIKTKGNFFLNYLRIGKIKLDTEEFIFQLETHPEYPSLLAYHDSLNFFSIPNLAVKIRDKDISNLPNHFIAEIQSKLALINRKNNQFNVENSGGENFHLTEEKFQELWSGVVLVAEKENEQKVKKKISRSLLFGFITISLAFVISFFSIYLSIALVLVFCGLFFSIEAIKQDLNIDSGFSDKFCNISTETDCNAIINSNSFKLFNLFGLSDVSIIFFIGQFLSVFVFLVIGSENDFFTYSSITLLLSMPVLLYSIYYQWVVAKKWCTICLGIILVLLIQLLFLNFYLTEISLLDYNYTEKSIFLFLLSFVLSSIGWLIVKPFLSSYFNLVIENKKLFKFKRNYDLFKASLFNEKQTNYENLTSEIFLGDKDAKLKLTLVTNLLCKHCKDMHSVIEHLMNRHSGKIKINILFHFYPDSSDTDLNLTRKLHIKLLDNYFNKGQELFLESLGEWFTYKNFDKWFKKYGENSVNDIEYSELLKKQFKQNNNNDIKFTPSFFIGEYAYPKIYDKKDILLYIDDLLEEKNTIARLLGGN